MSRRRRLALRQIDEPDVAVALSDVEDERDVLMQAETRVQEPNFSLLPGMMMNVGSTPEAPIELHDSDEEMADDHPPTQLVSSQSQPEEAAAPQPKKPRIERDNGSKPRLQTPAVTGAEHPKGVFQLYQTGLCADHTLRLHFIRRRPPPPPAKRVEDEFVLPRPRISLADGLPPTTVAFSDLLHEEAIDHDTAISTESHDAIRDLDKAIRSAQDHWRKIPSADASTILTWRALQEHEWRQVLIACGGFIPPTEDLIHVMKTLQTDAFAIFVWKELLPAIVRRIHSEKSQSTLPQLASVLLNHLHFRRLPAKDFRTQLRGHELRAIDAVFGMEAEWELVTTFHKLRKSD